MALEALTAKANTGTGTDQLAVIDTSAGKAGAVALVTSAGNLVDGANPVPVVQAGVATETTLASIASAVRLEDTAHSTGDAGIVMLGIRWDSDTATTGNDGDYTNLKCDEAGRLKVAAQPGKYALVTGSITTNGGTVFCECSRGSNIIAHVVATSLVGHNATFEGSIDSTDGTNGAWFAIDAKRTNANTVELVTGVLAATPAYAWELSVNGFNYIRVRATAHTSGTALWKFQQAPYATEPVPVTQVTAAQPVSGTVTATVAGASLSAPVLVADVASAALTTTTTTAALTPSAGASYEVNIPVTAVTGTTPTLDVGIEESDDTGTNWFRVYDFPRITATGSYRSPRMPITGNRVRYVQTVTGTTPSFTRAINRLQISESVPCIRQRFDRSLASAQALNAVTPSLNVENCRNVQLLITAGTITTTAPALQLEGSDDNGVTWYAIGAPLTAVASTTVRATTIDIHSQLIRARVSTAGVSATLTHVLIKGF
jgi:hypothetical protein